MRYDYKFKVGQRVKTLDPNYPNSFEIIHGTVEDTYRDGVIIIWDKSLAERVDYSRGEFSKIGPSRKKKPLSL